MHTHGQITLLKKIAAIQIERSEDGKRRFGLISELPMGAQLTVCGDGFNPRTAKIECNGQFYFVFLQDIERPARVAHSYDSAVPA